MINKSHRFHGHNSLRYIYQHGQTVRDSNVSLRYGINKRRRQYRAAVVVSKKVNKSAVTRNRIRRRLYEFVRLNQAAITKPYDIVLSVLNEQIGSLPPEQLNQSLRDLFVQANIFEHRASSGQHVIVNKKEN